MGDEKLTDEQAQFLAECEEEFKDRYTKSDHDFMKLMTDERKKPPIVDPWYNKPHRPNYDWSRQNRDNREHGQGGRRHHNSDRRNNDRGYKNDRHAGKNYIYQRNSKTY